MTNYPDHATSGKRTLRLLGLVEGDPQTALSGHVPYMMAALDRKLHVVDCLDYGPTGVMRLALLALTFRPNRSHWRARYHTSPVSQRVLTRLMRARTSARAGEFDVALQVFGWAGGQPAPFTLYVDQTRLMCERGWPEWLPLGGRERESILASERDMYQRACHVFTMGAECRESLIAEYGLPAKKTTVVGGGLNFAREPPLRKLPAQPAALFVGREFKRKGGDTLIEAFQLVRGQLPDAELHIVGVAPHERIPGVHVYGKLADRAHVSALYARARVFCLPSRYEPWGFAFVEAMAHGVPCIGSSVQSIPEILGHGTAGLLVEPNDASGLAEAMMRVLTDDTLASELACAGRERARSELTWDRVAETMLSAISDIHG